MGKFVCFECGSDGEIHHHHVVPKRLGGTKTIPLCIDCHGKIHNIDFRNHGILTKKGLDDAKRKGVKLGKVENFSDETRELGRVKMRENAVSDPSWILVKEFIINNKSELLNKKQKINFKLTANKLNENGFRTRRNCLFTTMSVKRLIERFGLK